MKQGVKRFIRKPLILLCSFFIGFSGCSTVLAQESPESLSTDEGRISVVPFESLLASSEAFSTLSTAYQIVSREKMRIESAGETLIMSYKHDKFKFGLGRFHYKEARAGFNAWIKRVILDLRTDKKFDQLDDSIIKSLSASVEKSNDLVEYVRSLEEEYIVGDQIFLGREIGGKAPDLLLKIFQWVMEVYQFVEDNKEEKVRRHLMQELEKLKIRSFGALEIMLTVSETAEGNAQPGAQPDR